MAHDRGSDGTTGAPARTLPELEVEGWPVDELPALVATLGALTTRAAARLAAAQRVPAPPSNGTPAAIEDLLDVRATARLLGRSVSWVHHHREAIPGRRQHGKGRVRYVKAELVRWLRAGGC